MNNFKPLLLIIAYLLVTFLNSCKKDPVIVPQNPDPQGTVHLFKIAIPQLPNMNAPQNNLVAKFTIKKKDGTNVIIDKSLALTYTDKYLTGAMELPTGEYQLSSLLVYDHINNIQFASPLTGSAKANQVATPLPIAFHLKNTDIINVTAEVAIVNAGDKPEDFGYPAGTFTKPNEQSTHIKLNARTIIKVGDIVYDSIPSTLRVTTWDLNNDRSVAFVSLKPGDNEVTVSKAIKKVHFFLDKWQINDEKTFTTTELAEGMRLVFGGEKEAKKLSAVSTTILTNGMYRPLTKKDYFYNPQGNIIKAIEYKKNEANETVVNYTENFFYNTQHKISKIQKQITNGGTTEELFEYRTDGRVQSMKRTEPEGVTTAQVNYMPGEGYNDLSHYYTTGIAYNFTQYYYTKTYILDFYGGIVSKDMMTTSHQDYTSGRYNYDFSINPYIHLNIPDLYFENSWKHNKIADMKEYENVFPITIPYERTFSYDDEGYPTQLIVKYKKYLTGEFSHQTKSVFYY